MKLFDRSVCPEDLLLLAKADHMGRVAGSQDPKTARAALEDSYAETEKKLRDLLDLYRQRMAEPYLMGKDLIDAGLRPGPVFTQALDYAHKLRLAGLPKEEQLRQTLGFVRSLKKTEKCP
jgi:tRNA nucleotidyltransferase (CCA-adding enzyme)